MGRFSKWVAVLLLAAGAGMAGDKSRAQSPAASSPSGGKLDVVDAGPSVAPSSLRKEATTRTKTPQFGSSVLNRRATTRSDA